MRLESFRARLAGTLDGVPQRTRWRSAAVAIIVRDGACEAELLLVKRTARAGDRWSGHIAFPGGLSEPRDACPAETARREAEEEVGLVLGPPLGRLGKVYTARPEGLRPLTVFPFVFEAPNSGLHLEAREVAEALWVPWSTLCDPSRRVWSFRRLGPLRVPFPVIRMESHVIWGLTLSMVNDLGRKLSLSGSRR
jgi:8-oxo-dGTP pyrophosphatase MutT (NUDIX family)